MKSKAKGDHGVQRETTKAEHRFCLPEAKSEAEADSGRQRETTGDKGRQRETTGDNRGQFLRTDSGPG